MTPTLINMACGLVLGACWRVALGHDWSAYTNVAARHARSILLVTSTLLAAALLYEAGAPLYAMALGAVLTSLNFAQGNGAVLQGVNGSVGGYVLAQCRIYLLPACSTCAALWYLGHPNIMPMAGILGGFGYWFFQHPFSVGESPWNWRAEAFSGAAWFMLLAVPAN